MDDALLTEYIIQQFGKHVSRDNLIYDICQRTGRDWNSVNNLVAAVEQTHATKIARKQTPLLLIIALGILIAGMWAAGGAMAYYIDLIQTGNFSLDPMSLRRDYVMLIRFGTGVAMIFGALVGAIDQIWKMVSP
ncbi:MAG: hypothetical protein HZB51_33425 [Chloroflexi bacterium]|nr:hypothetical protein [Chloroflexota bacterium]